MTRHQIFLLGAIGAVILVLVLGVIWWPWSSSSRSSGLGTATDARADQGNEVLTLYFPGSDRRLEAEERDIEGGLSFDGKARRILQEMIAGPRREGLFAPLPSEIEVQGTYLGENQVLYVDLHRPENGPPPAAGSLQEQLTVFSLVNSLTANLVGVDRVAILWNGNQPASLSGHLDNTKPVKANLALVAASP